MKPHSALMIALKDHLARSSFTQPEAANLFGVPQLRFCDLTRSKISLTAPVTMAVPFCTSK